MTAPSSMPAARRRVLIVEDEPDLVRGLRDALEFEGFEVVAAGLGREGVRLARERGPDLVLLDLMLPDMNGFSVCEEIRAANPTIPVIMLTARSQESDKIRGLEVGADDYVTKPFSVGELVARIGAIFRRLQRGGQPVTRDEILEKIWGVSSASSTRGVDNVIVKLRKKLEDDASNPRHIVTIYGTGYKLVVGG